MKLPFFMTRLMAACLLLAAFAITSSLQAQCYKPKPMTAAQIEMVKGNWKGTYLYKGESKSVNIHIYVSGGEVLCDVDTPPVAGKPDQCLYWFCDGGEFHLKKWIGTTTYSFQATPVNNSWEGLVAVRENEKTVGNGHFSVNRVQ